MSSDLSHEPISLNFLRPGARIAGGAFPCDFSEHDAAGKRRTRGIVIEKKPARNLAGRINPGERFFVAIQDFGFVVDLDSAEGESHASGGGIRIKRRRVDRSGKVAFGRR